MKRSWNRLHLLSGLFVLMGIAVLQLDPSLLRRASAQSNENYCGESTYDPSTHGCCDGSVYDLSTQGCCNAVRFTTTPPKDVAATRFTTCPPKGVATA